MLFGVCTSYENAEFIKNCGYDYIELSLAATAQMSNEEFENCKKTLEKADIKAKAFNCFFPATIKLNGPTFNLEEIKSYAEKALERASILGAETIVLGSGGSRYIAEGLNTDDCEEQFVLALKALGEIAEKYGITIVIEPLNKGETNFINSVSHAVELARKVNAENVKSLVDFFHFSLENEPDSHITDTCSDIAHVHLARGSTDRGVPNAKDIDDLNKWAGILKQIGYDNKLSIEANAKDFKTEIKEVRNLLNVFQN